MVFRNFFRPKEVKDVLAAINAAEMEEGAEGLRHIKRFVVQEVVEDAAKTKFSIKNDGLSARTLTFLLITNVLSRHLTSGQYHIYRGILSGVGHELLELWNYAVRQQQRSGHYSEEDAKKDLKWMKDQIEKVG